MKLRSTLTALALTLPLTLTTAGVAQAATGPCTVKLSDHATPGEANSQPGVHAAMQALYTKNGGTLCVDKGQYRLANYIDLDSIPRTKVVNGSTIDINVRFIGEGMSTGFIAYNNSPIFFQGNMTPRPGGPAFGYGQYRYNSGFENMKLIKPAGTIGRTFDFRTGAQVNARFINLEIDNAAAGSNGAQNESFYFGTWHQFHGNLMENLRIMQKANNTSAVYKQESTHNYHNNNRMQSSTIYRYGSTAAPCIELKPKGSNTNNAFRSITGQNCAGGFIHLYGQNGGGIYDSSDWDNGNAAVFRDSVRIGRAAGTHNTTGFVLSGLGKVEQPNGQTHMMAGRHLIAIGQGSTGISVLGGSPFVNTGLVY